MEIRVHGPGQEPEALAVTMRTPGNDFELAVGFCATEGLLGSFADLEAVAYCLGGAGEQEYNVVTVKLRHRVDLRGRERSFVANASCGLCGKTSLDQVEQQCSPVGPGPIVTRSVIAALPDRLRDAQDVFAATGGLHASAWFTAAGELVASREDVGRHNALDKLIGHALLERRLPLSDAVLMVSGRVSFEIVQKAAIAGIPVICAVSAPSSLARGVGTTARPDVDRVRARRHRQRLHAPRTHRSRQLGTEHLWPGRPRRGSSPRSARSATCGSGSSRTAWARPSPTTTRRSLQTLWENRDNLPYAWRILHRGVCDGCALGVAGFHDWTISGVHLCTTRLNLLRVNTMGALDPECLADVEALRRLRGRELRDLGRLAHPMVRRRGEPGFTPCRVGRSARSRRAAHPGVDA